MSEILQIIETGSGTFTITDNVASTHITVTDPDKSAVVTSDIVGPTGPPGPQGPNGPVGPIRMPVWIPNQPIDGEVIFRGIAAENFAFTANNCLASANTAPTANSTFKVDVNGSQVCSITFSPPSQNAVFSFTSTTVLKGQIFELVAPTPADTTLADIMISLYGLPT